MAVAGVAIRVILAPSADTSDLKNRFEIFLTLWQSLNSFRSPKTYPSVYDLLDCFDHRCFMLLDIRLLVCQLLNIHVQS